MMPHGTPNGGFPPQGHGPGGPQKTVALPTSEGVVSMTHRPSHAAMHGGAPQVQVIEGASTLFWIVCLFMGIAVGVLAYVIVLQTV